MNLLVIYRKSIKLIDINFRELKFITDKIYL